MILLRVVLVLHTLLVSVLAQKPIDQIFDVDFDSDDNGGCRSRRDELQQMWSDVWGLASAGASITSDATVPFSPAMRVLDAYFRNPSIAQKVKVTGTFQKVRDFMANGGLAFGAKTRPALFCGDSWLMQQTWDSPGFDSTGKQTELKLRDMEPKFFENYGSDKNIAPYYSPVYKSYLPDTKRVRSSGKFFGYCDDKGSQATTQFNLGGGGITLCPQAFKPTDLNGAKRDTRLGATEPECLDLPLRRGIPKKRQEILEVYCTAMTLYHELFHLVLGSKASPDYAEGGKLLGYDTTWMLKDALPADTIVNPETYTVAALSYWYTQNKHDKNAPERPVGYETGICLFNDK